ncbi:MAG: GerMN domain-containing protein [Nocardioidaceae bacterium]|nr:GerMN domain-containing protein [Nocardioidaceae bacterium]
MTAGRRLIAVLWVFVLASLLMSCVSIPESSDVSPGRGMSAPEGAELINNIPPGPSPGQSQLEVVQGFYGAMLAYPQTSAIAREFLTPKAAAKWTTQGLSVYEDQELVDNARGVSLLARLVGHIDERGSWTSLQPSEVGRATDLRLRQVEREWRIVNPPPGTFVSREYFDRYYDPFSLYFMDATRTVLTPDPVYALLGDTTATALVSGLLEGPTKRLAAVVSVSTPRETEVDVSVSISDSGVAQVPLSEDFLQLSPEDRQLFAAQLAWTLRQVPEIERITLSVDGSEIDVPGVGEVFGVDEFAGFDPAGFAPSQTLFALGRKGLVKVVENTTSVVSGAPGEAGAVRSAAVSITGTLGAYVPAGGGSVVVDSMARDDADEIGGTWFRFGTDLIKPSWDVHEVLWLVDRTPVGAKIYAVTEDKLRQVRAPGLDGAAIESFAVSRDGVRLAAVVAAKNSFRLVIALINRDSQDPAKVALKAPTHIQVPGFSLTKGSNVAWASPTSVVALTTTDGGMPEPVEIAIDGSSQSETGGFLPARPVSVAAGPNEDAPVAFGTADGQIYARSPDLLWLRVGGPRKLRSPFYPG